MIQGNDLTQLFKATVKTVKTFKRFSETPNSESNKPDIFPKKKITTEFTLKAKNLVNTISQLQNFLFKHHEEYTASGNLLKESLSEMTEDERNQIDSDAQKYMLTCKDALKILHSYLNEMKTTSQTQEHYKSVISIIEGYLENVCNLYSSQRAIRLKKIINKKQISKLQPSKTNKLFSPIKSKEKKENVNEINSKINELGQETINKSITYLDDFDEEIKDDEKRLLKQENNVLLEELNSMGEAVSHVEHQVVEISQLQAIFNDNVLEQEKVIDHISDNVVGSSENIKDANDEIRQAMKNNSGLRVWILFFIIISTLSLWFMDWYNP